MKYISSLPSTLAIKHVPQVQQNHSHTQQFKAYSRQNSPKVMNVNSHKFLHLFCGYSKLPGLG